jgi:hypothetical protein
MTRRGNEKRCKGNSFPTYFLHSVLPIFHLSLHSSASESCFRFHSVFWFFPPPISLPSHSVVFQKINSHFCHLVRGINLPSGSW